MFWFGFGFFFVWHLTWMWCWYCWLIQTTGCILEVTSYRTAAVNTAVWPKQRAIRRATCLCQVRNPPPRKEGGLSFPEELNLMYNLLTGMQQRGLFHYVLQAVRFPAAFNLSISSSKSQPSWEHWFHALFPNLFVLWLFCLLTPLFLTSPSLYTASLWAALGPDACSIGMEE